MNGDDRQHLAYLWIQISYRAGTKTHTQRYEVSALRPSAGVKMIGTEHILLTFGGRKAIKAAQPMKGDRSPIMRGKWKSLQEWLIFTDSGRGKRGRREGL